MSDDTLRMLRDSAADFALLDAARVRRLRGTDPGFERSVWRSMADMGWLGVLIPEKLGGLGLGTGRRAHHRRATRTRALSRTLFCFRRCRDPGVAAR